MPEGSNMAEGSRESEYATDIAAIKRSTVP
jgi:hypothetical protein